IVRSAKRRVRRQRKQLNLTNSTAAFCVLKTQHELRKSFMRKTRRNASSTLKGGKIGDLGAPVEVRRHPGARRLTLRVSRTRRTVIVTLPVQCDLDEAGSFITRNIEWVRARLDSLPVPVPF